jgi:hypothetical protein
MVLQIFVLELKNDKWFLHISNNESYKFVNFECRALYEFVRKNPPIGIFESLPIFNKFEINTLTKKYMEYYGIDNVRGGIYSDEILPDYLKKSLELEFSQSLNNYQNKVSIFDNVYKKPTITSDDFVNEHNSYMELINMGYNEITRDFISELEWLENIILYQDNYIISKEDIKKYRQLLKKMIVVQQKYFQLNEDKIKLELTPNIKYPEFVFDFFIYHKNNNRDWEKDKTKALDVLKNYELMGYTIINILDCMEFDFHNPIEK